MIILLQVLIISYALIDVKHLMNVLINLLLHYLLDPSSLRVVLLLNLGNPSNDPFYLIFFIFDFVSRIYTDDS